MRGLSAFNPGWKNPNLYDDQVRGTASIIAAIKKAGIKKVLWVGGAGGLEVKPGVRVIDSPDMPLWVKPGSLATINALDQLRKEPELEWSYLSPSAELKPGQRTGKFRIGIDQLLVDTTGQSKISTQDYAVAMIDELERPTHVRQRFTGRVLKASSHEHVFRNCRRMRGYSFDCDGGSQRTRRVQTPSSVADCR